MDILMTGGAGFVGAHLIRVLKDHGHSITVVDAVSPPEHLSGEAFFIQADTTFPGAWQKAVHTADAVVNLTGKNIFHFWTRAYKDLIYDSRILTTRNIVSAMDGKRSGILVSTSAAGFYGDRGNEKLDEISGPGDDFLARVCVDWEREALLARDKGIRVVCARFGVVMGRGGALSKMVPPYRLFIGGPLGDGSQWFPWIQEADLAAAVSFLLQNEILEGPVNCCSPNPVRNREFAKTLGRTLNRPAFFRTPAFFLKFFAGELGRSLLNSQRTFPAKLMAAGFRFRYPDLGEALAASIA